jgi:hypothetical protein
VCCTRPPATNTCCAACCRGHAPRRRGSSAPGRCCASPPTHCACSEAVSHRLRPNSKAGRREALFCVDTGICSPRRLAPPLSHARSSLLAVVGETRVAAHHLRVAPKRKDQKTVLCHTSDPRPPSPPARWPRCVTPGAVASCVAARCDEGDRSPVASALGVEGHLLLLLAPCLASLRPVPRDPQPAAVRGPRLHAPRCACGCAGFRPRGSGSGAGRARGPHPPLVIESHPHAPTLPASPRSASADPLVICITAYPVRPVQLAPSSSQP